MAIGTVKTGYRDKIITYHRHMLTMSSGFGWNEEIPYDNLENSEIRMN